MSDFLTRRGGPWHFVRRVAAAFADCDPRGIIRHSTRIRVADDRLGRRAGRAALLLNQELELYWRGLAGKGGAGHLTRYEEVRKRAKALGFEYIENGDLNAAPLEHRLARIETLVAKRLVEDKGARDALLGTVAAPSFSVSQLFEQYEAAVRDEIRDMSPDQLRIWRNGRQRAVDQFVKVVVDKPLAELTVNDAIDYTEWWRERVMEDGVAAKSANKMLGS